MNGGSSNVILLSGGLDSATALASLVERNSPVRTLFVDYGQAAREEEKQAAAGLATHYGVDHREVLVHGFEFGSAEITGRNALLLSIGLIGANGASALVIGTHPDNAYWDCTEDFLNCMQRLVDGYTGGRVQVLAPFAQLRKVDVCRLAESLGVPTSRTYSCEEANGPCGACLSCHDAEANVG